MKKDVHVMPDQSDWVVKMQDEETRFDTQEQAEKFGREAARSKKVEFFLHGKDGRIRERDSYGNDPRDIPG